MSKLAHSNDLTMEAIALQVIGIKQIKKLPEPPKPICEAATPPKWYRPKGGRCPWRALWVLPSGKKLCRIHAKKEIEP